MQMTPRARATDPITSHKAAERSGGFAESHCDRIMSALVLVGPSTAHELMRLTGLTVVQIDRRMPELERAGRARVAIADGKPRIRFGARVWEAC